MAALDLTMSHAAPSPAVSSPQRHVRSRTQSFSSDRPSAYGYSLMSPPLAVSPEAAYIAASAASQIVTNDHDIHSETWYDQVGIEPSGETALVSTSALQLANNFVDQLLFNILAVAGSTALAALRPAVIEVLKPKLAKDAIGQADEELREYLGGDEVEDLVQPPNGEVSQDWDLELVWKRTRLRCMVYSSLGDMEEEDEDYYMEQGHFNDDSEDPMAEIVSPAVAIFLTSILEFMGEQILVVSGQAAFNSMRMKYEKELREGHRIPGDMSERIVVDEVDMERVAFDRTIGRLWRTWKKRMRTPGDISRPYSRNSITHGRQGSVSAADTTPAVPAAIGTNGDVVDGAEATEEASAEKETEPEKEPHEIPLPEKETDDAEIAIPGLTYYLYEQEEEVDEWELVSAPRPQSALFSAPISVFATSETVEEHSMPAAEADEAERVAKRQLAEVDDEVDGNAPNAEIEETDEVEKAGDDDLEPIKPLPVERAQLPRSRARSLPPRSKRAYVSPDEEPTVEEPEAEAEAEAEAAADTVDTAKASEVESSQPEQEEEVSQSKEQAQAEKPSAISRVVGTPVAKIVTGAAAVGAAAVVGLAAVAQGKAFNAEPSPIDDGEIEEFTEEPQILTSSRVSISGSSSPSPSDNNRSSIIMPVRSNSVHSLRVVDVHAPRSPRSRTSSLDATDYSVNRVNGPAREGTASTPPISEEDGGDQQQARGYNKRNGVVVRSVDNELDQYAVAPQARQGPSPSASPAPLPYTHASSAPTKVTILSTSTSGGAFSEPEKPDSLQKMARELKTSPMPAVPEKSASRQAQAQAQAQAAAVPPPPVERPTRRGSPESPKVRRPLTTESPKSATSNKFKAMRSSEESKEYRAEDVARNFEQLIQSDQTLQYTLTPENMRDMDSARSLHNGSPVINSRNRKSEDAKQAERSRSSSLKRSISVSKSAGLSSHPPPPPPPVEVPSSVRLSGPIPRAPAASAAQKARASASGLARDARVPRESLQDFADFIRSTGPNAGSPVNGAPSRAVNGGPTAVRNSNGPTPIRSPNGVDSLRSAGNRTSMRPRLQARDAAVSATNESSELIDFIRRGPPNGSNNPRIPRNVAPFRTTADSDQMALAGVSGGKAIDANIPNIRDSNLTENSVPSSINSQSALLNKANKPSAYSGNNFDGEDMMPKRKQRRVRDPYAIDFSDEEEEVEMTPKPKPKTRQEESLIDFLKNYEPPPESQPTPKPFVAAVQQPPARAPKKKSSTSNLMNRLRSGGSFSGSPPLGANGSGPQSRSNSFNPDDKRALNSRASSTKGYTPITVHIPPDADKWESTYKSRPSGGPTHGRVQMKKFEPREAVSTAARTGDLAKFLRDSEPPPSLMPAMASPVEDRNPGFTRMFERRKKAAFT